MPDRSIQFFAKMNECALFFEGLVATQSLWRDKKLEVAQFFKDAYRVIESGEYDLIEKPSK